MEGKTIVFTGTLEVKRAEASKMAAEAGATVASGVTGKTDILVAGADAGSKIAAAKSKRVAIWSEADFLAALQSTGKTGKRKVDLSNDTAPAAKRPVPASEDAVVNGPAPVGGGVAGAAPSEKEWKAQKKVAAQKVAAQKAAAEAAMPAAEKVAAQKAAQKAAAEAKSLASTQPLAGMTFLRTGRFVYQKAVGDFVRSLGGTWVKTANQATATIDGGCSTMESEWSQVAQYQVLEQGKPVVPMCSCFKSNAETPGAVQEFLQTLQTARKLVDTNIKAGATSGDVVKAYQDAFPPSSWPSFPAGYQWPEPFSSLFESVLEKQGNKGLKWIPRA